MWDEMIEFEQKQQHIGTDDGEGSTFMDHDEQHERKLLLNFF